MLRHSAMKMEVKCVSESFCPSANYIAAHSRSSKYQFHKILTYLSPNICLCSLSNPVTNDAPCTRRQHSCKRRLTCARSIHVWRSVFGTNREGPRSKLHEGTVIVTDSSHSTRPAVPQQSCCRPARCTIVLVQPGL